MIDSSYSGQAKAYNFAEQEFNYYDASKEFYEKSAALQKKQDKNNLDTGMKEMNIF